MSGVDNDGSIDDILSTLFLQTYSAAICAVVGNTVGELRALHAGDEFAVTGRVAFRNEPVKRRLIRLLAVMTGGAAGWDSLCAIDT